MTTAAADRASLLGRIRGVLARRDLLVALTHREVQVRYKQAFLGMAWAVFLPLSLMLVTTALKGGLAPGDDPAHAAEERGAVAGRRPHGRRPHGRTSTRENTV